MSGDYDATEIRFVTAREAVRLRPGMYVGDKDEGGLHQLVYELVENAFDEAVEGFGKRIQVTIHGDNSVTIADEGRGIPFAIAPTENRPIAELLMTTLHHGGVFDSNAYKVKGGLRGVGAACVNFMSEWLHLEVRREGKCYQQSYQTGIPTTDFTDIGPTSETGTTITFKPDASIFTITEFNFDRLAERLRQKAFLNKNIQITLRDERVTSKKSLVLFFKDGLADYIRHLNTENQSLHPDPIYFEKQATELIARDVRFFSEIHPTETNTSIEIALQYINSGDKNVLAFANQIPNPDGGTHVSGLYAGLTRAINQYGTSVHLMHSNAEFLDGRDTRAGLVAIIAISLPCPRYAGSIKAQLASNVSGIVESFVYQSAKKFFSLVIFAQRVGFFETFVKLKNGTCFLT